MKRYGFEVVAAVLVFVTVGLSVLFRGDDLLFLGVALFAGLFVFAVARRSKTTALMIWLVVVAIVPPWVSLNVAYNRVPVASLISALLIAAYINREKMSWRFVDLLVLSLCVSSFASAFAFNTPLHVFNQTLLEWGVCYLAGRVLYRSANIAVVAAVVGSILGILAIAQVAFSFNVSDLSIYSYATGQEFWMALQERAGLVRAELTFGHSIALGGVLAMLLPFTVARFRSAAGKASSLLICCGIIATYSRGAMLAMVAVIALTILASNVSIAAKYIGAILLAVSAVVGSQYLTNSILRSANSVELANSTNYREDLLQLFSVLNLSGLASGARTTDGATYRWLDFYSIDNAPLYVGLYAGIIAMVIYVLCYVVILIKAMTTKWSAPLIAIVAQFPLLITVAPITQYQNFYWLFIGIAVSSASYVRATGTDESPAPIFPGRTSTVKHT